LKKKVIKNITGRFWAKETKNEFKKLGIPFTRRTSEAKARKAINDRMIDLKEEIKNPRRVKKIIEDDLRIARKDLTILTTKDTDGGRKAISQALKEARKTFQKGGTPKYQKGFHLSGKYFSVKKLQEQIVKDEMELVILNGKGMGNKERRKKVVALRNLLKKFK